MRRAGGEGAWERQFRTERRRVADRDGERSCEEKVRLGQSGRISKERWDHSGVVSCERDEARGGKRSRLTKVAP